MIDEQHILQLREKLQEKRECGIVHFSVGEIPEFNQRRPDKAIANGYAALHIAILEESRWYAIDAREAEFILNTAIAVRPSI